MNTPAPRIPDGVRIGATLVLSIAQVAATQVHRLGFGEDIGSRAGQSPSLSTPAGWAFGIWSLIYLGLIAFAVYQALPAHRHDALLRRAGPWTAAAMLLGAVWAIVAQLQGITLPTVVILLAMLACALCALFALRDGAPFRWRVALFVRQPIGLFAGWVTAAALVNLASWLPNAGGAAEALRGGAFAALVALCATLLAGWVTWRARAPLAYPLAGAWALAGVAAKAAPAGAWLAAVCAGAGAVLLVGLGLALALAWRTRPAGVG
ncbi:hypothetical protein WG922_03265 [Ramlibacter sp. AN1015]|uniref:hypothetical protein n=1 Tax=Ramlibacter sp. AN1015 TaxID=3133428 RepID=UPI0030BB7A1F